MICSNPNQQYYISTEECVMTRTVNPQDATRKGTMTRTVKVITMCVITRKSESEGTYFHYAVSTKTDCK